MTDYSNPSYWDERYSFDGSSYDWYQDFTSLSKYISPYLRRDVDDFEILIPGCGSSRLGADLYDAGYTNITSIDISPVVINQLVDRYGDREEMEFSVMDARNMDQVPDNCFDLVLDKGLFDALACSDANTSNIGALVSEVYRVLKPRGIYILITHAVPEYRVPYLQKKRFTLDHLTAPKPTLVGLDDRAVNSELDKNKLHHIFICQKVI